MDYDYVIAGGGAAGCVLAARLSEDAHITVLLIEAGGGGRHPLIGIPGANVATTSHLAFNWNDESAPEPALGGRRMFMAQGRGIGGGGAINGMMMLRGKPADYDSWAGLGCPGWGWSDVLPFFRKAETNARGASALHGGNGPMRVQRGQATAPICDIFVQAAGQAGFETPDDMNGPAREAVGYVDLAQHRGRRQSTAAAYLRPAQKRPNLTVLTRAQVTGIEISGNRATGLRYQRLGAPHLVKARREVILAAGAIGSPALLMLSGIGPADELRRLGIPVIHDAPDVGQHLQNHPSYKLMYETDEAVTGYSHIHPLGMLKAGLNYLFRRKGPLASGVFPVAGFVDGNPDDPRGSVQLCMAPALIIRRGPGIRKMLPQRHGFTILVNQGIPYSEGSVTLASADPMTRPIIQGNAFTDPRDLGILAAATNRIRTIMQTPAMKAIGAREIQPAGPIRSQDDIEADILRNAATHYHYGGTCRMGTDAGAVLDPQMRVHGIDGLRVVDASAMPRMVNGNTYAPTIMIAERAAHFIRN